MSRAHLASVESLIVAFILIPGRSTRALKLASQRNQCAHGFVAQVHSAPNKQSDVDRKQCSAEKRSADPQLRRDRAAEVPGQKYCAEHGRPWKQIERDANDLDDAERARGGQWIAELSESLHDRRDLQDVNDPVEEQEECAERANDAPSPQSLCRHTRCCSVCGHLSQSRERSVFAS